jgi:NADH-ubiquinone oxidoreductase B12 subunit family
MDQPSVSLATEMSAQEPRGSTSRLHGHWLLFARVGWIVLTLLILTLNVVMIPRYYAVLQAHCQPGPQCFALQLNTYDRQFLHQFGLSPGFIAAYQVILDGLSVLVYCALGALIFWRKSADRMALFCAFMLVLFGGAGLTNILQDALMPVSPAWFTLIGTLELLGQTSFMIFFFLFPSGRFVPRWIRWIVPCIVLYWIYTIFYVNSLTNGSLWSLFAFFALLLFTVGGQVYRYHRISTSRERQQTKWVVFGFSIGIVGFVLSVVLEHAFLPPELHQSSVLQTLVVGTLIYGFLLLVPISIAIAILRSRLYDIDIVINRALVYGSLTGILGVLYAGLIIGLESLAGAITGQASGQPVALVISTLAIYALFQPVRKSIQALIDRRFYRKKYDAEKTLAAFSIVLRSEVDLNQLREQLLAVVQETMQPAHVSLWLRQPEQSTGDQVHRLTPQGQMSPKPDTD